MKDNKKNGKNYSTIKILQNATVIYDNGDREIFEAVYVTKRGVYIGRIVNHNEFMEYGFITAQIIKKILNGSKKKLYKKFLK